MTFDCDVRIKSFHWSTRICAGEFNLSPRKFSVLRRWLLLRRFKTDSAPKKRIDSLGCLLIDFIYCDLAIVRRRGTRPLLKLSSPLGIPVCLNIHPSVLPALYNQTCSQCMSARRTSRSTMPCDGGCSIISL